MRLFANGPCKPIRILQLSGSLSLGRSFPDYLVLGVLHLAFAFGRFGCIVSLLEYLVAKGIAELHQIVETSNFLLFHSGSALRVRPRIDFGLSWLAIIVIPHISLHMLTFDLVRIRRPLMRVASNPKPTAIFIE